MLTERINKPPQRDFIGRVGADVGRVHVGAEVRVRKSVAKRVFINVEQRLAALHPIIPSSG